MGVWVLERVPDIPPLKNALSDSKPSGPWQTAVMRIAAVHHLAVRTSDLAASERFYSGVLGLPALERFVHPDGSSRSGWVGLPDGTFLALEATRQGARRRDDHDAGWHCIALRIEVADRERWRQRLEEAGHPVERESDFTLYVRDPDGALVGLSHHPERA